MADASGIERHIGVESRTGDLDAAIGGLATQQHGVVSRAQLLRLGLGRGAIERRLRRGRLHLVHRGVYAVGHTALKPEARWVAAVLAAGPGAVLSHRTAGAHWGVLSSVQVEVTAAREVERAGMVVHFARLPPDEITAIDGIPVTTVPRTLLDLAAVLRPARVERAVNEAEYLRLTDPLSLCDLLTRYPRRKGSATIRAILEAGRAGSDRQRSELESAFVEFLDEHGLPRPAMNQHVEAGGTLYECDCVWRDARLVVELDSRSAHDTTAGFERDRARDRALAVAEWRVVRVTWRALHEDPAGLAADLREVTSQRWRRT